MSGVYSDVPLLVTIEDHVILRMIRDERFLTEFPYLQTQKQALATTTCCGGKNRQARQVDYNAVKRYLAELPDDKKLRLKQLLPAQQARVHYRADNRTVTLTF